MRSHVRRWINEWHLKRLSPESAVTIREEQIGPTHGEDAAMEEPGGRTTLGQAHSPANCVATTSA
jgi:hypothetical protein